jgi:AmmeMemoRadiSam system protein B
MKSSNIRKAMFAGSWYPASAPECESQIAAFLSETEYAGPPERKPVGGIVPHAGWYFSGSIACDVIHHLKGETAPDVVVVFGMHLHAESPCYLMAEGAWETPFGEIPVEERLAAELSKKFEFRLETPDRFTQDNTVELQLPFIKYFFQDAKIVAVGVPPNKDSLKIGQTVVDLAKQMGLSIIVIGSTDLTHYGYNYGFTSRGTGKKAVDWVRTENDRRVIEAILALEPERVMAEARAGRNACCAGAAATAIEAAKNLGASQAQEIAYATSYDKSPGDSFVGYVGIVMSGAQR